MPQTNPDQEEIMVIGIAEENIFLVENLEKNSESSDVIIRGLENIKEFISAKNAEYFNRNKKMKVRIRSNWFLPIKYTMEIALYCDAMDIEKGLDVRRVSRK